MDFSFHSLLLPYRQQAVKGYVAISAADAQTGKGYVADMVTRIGRSKPPRVFIDEWMEHRGLGDAEVAGRIGIDRTTVWKWRQKVQKLDVSQLTGFADALDITFNDLFRLPPPKDAPPPKPSVDAILKDLPDELQDTVIDLAQRLHRRAS